jgi:hypothetical protein
MSIHRLDLRRYSYLALGLSGFYGHRVSIAWSQNVINFREGMYLRVCFTGEERAS